MLWGGNQPPAAVSRGVCVGDGGGSPATLHSLRPPSPLAWSLNQREPRAENSGALRLQADAGWNVRARQHGNTGNRFVVLNASRRAGPPVYKVRLLPPFLSVRSVSTSSGLVRLLREAALNQAALVFGQVQDRGDIVTRARGPTDSVGGGRKERAGGGRLGGTRCEWKCPRTSL